MDLQDGTLLHSHFNWRQFKSTQQVSELSNKIAQIFEDAGFKPGDTVALVMDNRPEYVAIWLGLAKAGVVAALINYNLKGSPLAHSISIVESKAVIFAADFSESKSGT